MKKAVALRCDGHCFDRLVSVERYPYTILENPRARRVTITIRRDGSVFVTKPRRVSEGAVRDFIEKNEAWIDRARAKYAGLPKTSRIESSLQEYKRYRRAARELLARRVEYFSRLYGVRVRGITIRNQRSRWGSCSHSGTVSLNYRILFLQEKLADYVIVHEVCHLREMNHSKHFWSLVAQAVPEHRTLRKELRARERHLLVH